MSVADDGGDGGDDGGDGGDDGGDGGFGEDDDATVTRGRRRQQL